MIEIYAGEFHSKYPYDIAYVDNYIIELMATELIGLSIGEI